VVKPDPIFQRIRPLDRTPNVAQQVAEHLARLIATGSLAPGEKLPGETVLSERLGVSRPSLREALQALRDRGLVTIRPRSGTYVAERLDEQAAAESQAGMAGLVDGAHLWDVLEMRRTLDPESAALAARRRTPADLARLRDLMREGAELSGEELLRWKDGARVYGRFFLLISRATHNALFSRLTEALAEIERETLAYSRLRLATWDQTGKAGRAGEEIRRQFVTILQAVEAGDPVGARAATAEHLDSIERTLREIEVEDR
jgi:GntR family transcriptional regulator, transcriptional repressor for pyruvate dehydrogenase complex